MLRRVRNCRFIIIIIIIIIIINGAIVLEEVRQDSDDLFSKGLEPV